MKKDSLPLTSLAILALVLCVGTTMADELSDLKDQVSDLQKRIAQLEQQQKQREAARQQGVQTTLPDSLRWLENVKISGDLRYRFESIDEQSGGDWKAGVNRNRIRARLGLEAKVNDEWGLGFRLATGTGDPVSTNVDLDKSFSEKDIWIDRAFFTWHPAAMKGFDLVGGKMANPFYAVGHNQLIWDHDLNPEGLAARYQEPLSDSSMLSISGGGFWVERASDTSLWGLQSYVTHKLRNDDYLMAGASYYDYGNIEGQGDLYTPWAGGATPKWWGNTFNGTPAVFANDYNLIEGFAEYGFEVGATPVSLFGDYVYNTAASDKNTGWLAGFTFNETEDPGSWAFRYDYRDLDADAVVGQFNDSDFIGGGTNGKGHLLGLTYQLAKNVQAGLTYYLDKKKDSYEDKYHRLQADLLLKF
ncbi:MAG: putative porin [Sedimentisphaerales bacterium]